MLDSGFMPPRVWARVTKTSKAMDVLLPLRVKQRCFGYLLLIDVAYIMYQGHSICLLPLQLNTNEIHWIVVSR